jgi:hypothetical protein
LFVAGPLPELGLHFCYRSFEAHENGTADDVVADIELGDLHDSGEPRHIPIGEPVSGCNQKAQCMRVLGGRSDSFHLAGSSGGSFTVCRTGRQG